MREAECNTVSQSFEGVLKRIPDPRHRRGQRYAWETLLLVICAALVSGQQTGAAIAQWVVEHAGEWQAWAPTTAGRIPSAATVRRALRLVDAAAVERALGAWVSGCLDDSETELRDLARPPPALRAVALDGKAVRGAQTHKPMAPRSIWSAWSRTPRP